MDRSRVTELHYITPITNLTSIMQKGIVSHNDAEHIAHDSVADQDVQDLRVGKKVPNGAQLHDYVNLYFDARNPMMFKRRDIRSQIAVIRVHPEVLDIPGTVITDGNAASNATAFYASPAGLAPLDGGRVYAEYWTDADPWTYWEKKRQRCAEVLVPKIVPTTYIKGCYACSDEAAATCVGLVSDLVVEVHKIVYFLN